MKFKWIGPDWLVNGVDVHAGDLIELSESDAEFFAKLGFIAEREA